MTLSDTNARAVVAVAATHEGRHVFVGLDTDRFTRVSHFPASISEGHELAAACSEPSLTRDQLIATYASAVVVVPLRETGLAAN